MKEILQKLVLECNSYAEILRKQNKAVSGSALKILKLFTKQSLSVLL